jgi:hypothetical protein
VSEFFLAWQRHCSHGSHSADVVKLLDDAESYAERFALVIPRLRKPPVSKLCFVDRLRRIDAAVSEVKFPFEKVVKTVN